MDSLRRPQGAAARARGEYRRRRGEAGCGARAVRRRLIHFAYTPPGRGAPQDRRTGASASRFVGFWANVVHREGRKHSRRRSGETPRFLSPRDMDLRADARHGFADSAATARTAGIGASMARQAADNVWSRPPSQGVTTLCHAPAPCPRRRGAFRASTAGVRPLVHAFWTESHGPGPVLDRPKTAPNSMRDIS